MAENWWAKLITFIIVFGLFWLLGGLVLKDWTIGFFVGIVVGAIFVGVGSIVLNKK